MAKLIEITVSPQGDVKVRTKGFAGRSCVDASREIEQALGEPLCSATRTAEYYQTEREDQQQERANQ